MFYGQYHHQLDDKGRFRIPTAFREQLGDKPMMIAGFEKCLVIYKAEDFQALITKRFADADMLDVKMNDIKRTILPNVQEIEIDKQGRTAINPSLKAKCGMSKNIISIGLLDHVEVWDEQLYEEHMIAIDMEAILAPFSSH